MHTVALINSYLPRLAALCAGVIALSLFCYGAFLLLAVTHAAKHAAAQREVAEATLAVAELQQRYLSQTRSLTLTRAKELGFTEPATVITVYAGAGRLTLGN